MNCFKKNIKKENYKTFQIDKKIDKNDAIDHVLDLNHEKFDLFKDDQLFLDCIITQLETNKDIFFLNENKKFKNSKSFIKNLDKINEIEKLLSENKLANDLKDDYIHFLISNQVFCSTTHNFRNIQPNQKQEIEIPFDYSFQTDKLNDQINFIDENIFQNDINYSETILQELTQLNWIIHSKYEINGYKCIAYINEQQKQIIVAYQGIKYKFKDLFTKSYKSYLSFLNNLIREHLKLLTNNVKEYVELSDDLNYSLSFTGYSFGALFAQLSVFICNKYLNKTQVKSIVFESIGVYELLNELNNSTNLNNIINLNDLNIRIYLSYPNFINTINNHVGKIISPYGLCINGKLKSCHKNDCKADRKEIKCNYSSNNLDPFYMCGLKSLISLQLKSFKNHFEANSFFYVNNWPINYNIKLNNKLSFGFIKSNNDLNHQIDSIHKYLNKSLNFIFNKLNKIKEKRNFESKICYFEYQYFVNNDEKRDSLKKIEHKIDYTNIKQLKLLKEFFESTDHLLENYVDLNRNYDLSAQFIILKGESRSGKSTLAAKYSREAISKCEYLSFFWIDCSTVDKAKNVYRYDDYFKLNENKYRSLIILDNANSECITKLSNDSFFYNIRKNPFVKIIITTNDLDLNITTNDSDLNKDIYAYTDPKSINVDKLNKTECYLILERTKVYLKNILNENYNFDNFIDDLFKNEDGDRICFYKVNCLINMLKNTSYKIKSKNDILKFKEDIFDFIRCDNKSAYEFLCYIIYLDENNLNKELLKHIYALLYNYDSNFNNDKSFKINFNQDIDYLLQISILTKSYNNEYFIMNQAVRIEFENLNLISNEKRLRIIIANLVALNNLYNSITDRSKQFEELFYKNNFNIIIDNYWKKEIKKLIYSDSFKIYRKLIKNHMTAEERFSKYSFLTFENIDQCILDYNKMKSNKLPKKIKYLIDKIEELENYFQDAPFYLDKKLGEIKMKVQLALEKDIFDFKKECGADPNIDEYNLDEIDLDNFDLDNFDINELNYIPKGLRDLADEDYFNRIDEYHQRVIDSFKNKNLEIDLIKEDLKWKSNYNECFNYILKNLESDKIFVNYDRTVYFDRKYLFDMLKKLIIEFFKPIIKYANENFIDILSLEYIQPEELHQETLSIDSDGSFIDNSYGSEMSLKSSESDSTLSSNKSDDDLNYFVKCSKKRIWEIYHARDYGIIFFNDVI